MPKVIAEIGCNHKGEFDIAIELLDLAKQYGADVAKFQKRNNKELLTEEQYNAVHHYEDADGVYQDLTLYDFGTPAASWTAVTYRDRIENRNDDLKEIVVIKPSVINSIVSEFKSLMKQKL